MDEPDYFDGCWDTLADIGACDARGGMEYTRVYAEWVKAGCPSPVFEFIREAANLVIRSPDPKTGQ